MATTGVRIEIHVDSTQFEAHVRKSLEDAIAQAVEPAARKELRRQIAILREDEDS